MKLVNKYFHIHNMKNTILERIFGKNKINDGMIFWDKIELSHTIIQWGNSRQAGKLVIS